MSASFLPFLNDANTDLIYYSAVQPYVPACPRCMVVYNSVHTHILSLGLHIFPCEQTLPVEDGNSVTSSFSPQLSSFTNACPIVWLKGNRKRGGIRRHNVTLLWSYTSATDSLGGPGAVEPAVTEGRIAHWLKAWASAFCRPWFKFIRKVQLNSFVKQNECHLLPRVVNED